MNPLLYFFVFLKASLLSTGGLGNLPFLQKDLTLMGWAKNSDFVTAIAVGNISPGPTGLWSISLGYLTFGWLGAILALVAIGTYSVTAYMLVIVLVQFQRKRTAPIIQLLLNQLLMERSEVR